MVESFPDGVFLHAGQPQAGKGLFAPGLLVDQSEDQFALPSGITTVHHGINVCPVHEFFQNRKLLFGAGRHKVLPLLRQDGQVRDAPLHILLPIGTGRRKFHQMPHAPAYDIAAALKVAILPPMHS